MSDAPTVGELVAIETVGECAPRDTIVRPDVIARLARACIDLHNRVDALSNRVQVLEGDKRQRPIPECLSCGMMNPPQGHECRPGHREDGSAEGAPPDSENEASALAVRLMNRWRDGIERMMHNGNTQLYNDSEAALLAYIADLESRLRAADRDHRAMRRMRQSGKQLTYDGFGWSYRGERGTSTEWADPADAILGESEGG